MDCYDPNDFDRDDEHTSTHADERAAIFGLIAAMTIFGALLSWAILGGV